MSLSQIMGYQITRANLVALEFFARDVEKEFDLRPVEYTILQLVREGLCTTPSQLAKELAITPPSMSVWLDKLSARKLLSRSKSVSDGRASQVQLTASGTRLITQAHEALLKSEQRMLSVLSAGERVMLHEILQKLSKIEHSPA
ncbi:MarR family winged helix-turn-helix transcriptional regulator [Variovorax sp. PCZ-1]|uniref:MarR family winged helix-turn-helix transcriptional regulator n=1 Tax=Variovorax sp. PCZ-1 TaxID=2835533 RepID=UPI001BD01F48|nr:MarR family winged helix-turn-helix transcriptional regulator [Variovorax sp. PCZ-1]MBS7806911.1 winged helix-turn-helix transcriptional regulator [Variovorax sp. PCZ-1]